MKLYHIKESYVQYLSNFDKNVSINKDEKRPYIGVVLKIDNIKYYAPLTSPKAKHLKMKNGKDFRKIKGGEYGAINFNNMIPVPDEALILINITNEPNLKYRRLLQNQYKALENDFEMIEKTARNLRILIFKDEQLLNPWEKSIKSRCCNLSVLEKVYLNYLIQ